MKDLQTGRGIIAGAPEGHDAQLIAQLAKKAWASLRAPVLHIALDDARVQTLSDCLAYFAPEIEIVSFPAWDCLPYDRVSPHKDILALRAKLAARLTSKSSFKGPSVVITTVNGATQRLPNPLLFEKATLSITKGKELDRAHLQDYLVENGYHRSPTVREAGEFAIRGGIIDLFPAGFDNPVRIDLFGDEVETIKIFDAMSQRSEADLDDFTLSTVSELILNEETRERFRAKYREIFGAIRGDDPLYEAVGEGRLYSGMEHWLPLFYEDMTHIFSALPNSPILLDHEMQAVRQDRTEQIVDFYQSRLDTLEEAEKTGMGYKPLPPHFLYLDDQEWEKELKSRIVRELNPFPLPPSDTVIDGQGKTGITITAENQKSSAETFDRLKKHIQSLKNDKISILIACYSDGSKSRLHNLCQDHGIHLKEENFIILSLDHGFQTPELTVITEKDILGDRLTRTIKKKRSGENPLAGVTELNPGDLVVHVEHGIGRFEGLETIDVMGVKHDCLKLIYADDDKLFIPVENLEVLSRFGNEQSVAILDKLGGVAWQNRKARVKRNLLEIADHLIEIAAKRQLNKTPELSVPEGAYEEFCARFPYHETDDQLRAIAQVNEDLHGQVAMDRLVCGDVGFGKTEVALRAAFSMAMSGLQVAVVVPTTLLARQHYKTFVDRFKGFPIKIAQLSRFVTTKSAQTTRDNLKKGQVDIVIGTHALLSDKIKFSNLGLLIVDEEQNFGVKQKEKLKSLKDNVHVLTLTATPIPRTMQLAMSGVREMSIIATPPVDRLAVRTFVMPYDPVVIREALMREHYRGGQSFYVCPRISDLEELTKKLKELVPELKVIQAHGQMPSNELDDRMTAYYEGQYDVLLATNIIESGLDIPNANTLIVHRSEMFGLGQLYQIRGRVGRSKQRAYAYLTYKAEKKLTERGKQRLHVIGTLDQLGAGFQLASYDMDIRGAGNLLGEEQSGHIREIGVELYQQMLEEAVMLAKAGQGIKDHDNEWSPQINLGVSVMIPEDYITDLPVRLSLYRRLSSLNERDEIDQFAAEMIDRFGPLPEEVDNLLHVISLKAFCKKAGIERLDAGPKGAVITFRNNQFKNVENLVRFINEQLGTVKLRPDHKLAAIRSWSDLDARVDGVKKLVDDLAKAAA